MNDALNSGPEKEGGEGSIVGADSGEETTGELELVGASVVNVVNIRTEDSSGQGQKKSGPSLSSEIDQACQTKCPR